MKKTLILSLLLALNLNIHAEFTDIKGHWVENYVEYLEEENVIEKEDEFNPSKEITIGEFLKFVVKTKKSYLDDGEENKYEPYIKEALRLNLIEKIDDVNEKVTRKEAAVIANNYFKYKERYNYRIDEIEYYADDIENLEEKEEIIRIILRGIITPSNFKFNPDKNITRAEAAIIVARLKNEDFREKMEIRKKMKVRLKDIKDHWAEDTINKLVEKEIINGFLDNTFKPNEKIRLDQFLSLVFKAEDKKYEVSDEDYWAKDLIEKAKEYGYIDESLTVYNKEITREEVSEIIAKIIEDDNFYYDYVKQIKDFGNIDEENKKAVLKTYANGIINGYEDDTFRPKNKITRAEVTVIIDRVINEDVRKKASLELTKDELNSIRRYRKNQNLHTTGSYKNSIDFKDTANEMGKEVFIATDKAKTYVDMFYNINFLDIDYEEFKNQYSWVLGEENIYEDDEIYTPDEYRNKLIEEIEKDEIIVESKVYIYPSLVYVSKTGSIRVRGKLVYNYKSLKERDEDKINEVYERYFEVELMLLEKGELLVNDMFFLNREKRGEESDI